LGFQRWWRFLGGRRAQWIKENPLRKVGAWGGG
jgi:hypothetical protein